MPLALWEGCKSMGCEVDVVVDNLQPRARLKKVQEIHCSLANLTYWIVFTHSLSSQESPVYWERSHYPQSIKG